jgi:hypothetical protein
MSVRASSTSSSSSSARAVFVSGFDEEAQDVFAVATTFSATETNLFTQESDRMIARLRETVPWTETHHRGAQLRNHEQRRA